MQSFHPKYWRNQAEDLLHIAAARARPVAIRGGERSVRCIQPIACTESAEGIAASPGLELGRQSRGRPRASDQDRAKWAFCVGDETRPVPGKP